MKTAGQLFLEWYNDYAKLNGCLPSEYDVNFYWTGGNLETEKQQIIDVFILGQKSMFNVPNHITGEQYYENTFKN